MINKELPQYLSFKGAAIVVILLVVILVLISLAIAVYLSFKGAAKVPVLHYLCEAPASSSSSGLGRQTMPSEGPKAPLP